MVSLLVNNTKINAVIHSTANTIKASLGDTLPLCARNFRSEEKFRSKKHLEKALMLRTRRHLQDYQDTTENIVCIGVYNGLTIEQKL